MPGEVDEKSPHIKYLKEFRTQQCPDFLQHKCSHHRPYNCFNWHFLNQKRRRPFKKKDGAFNYNPDLYCPRYDETTGICAGGDDCNLLHRVAGDVERRYHPRYFKTCICVHETDSKGHCVKNGPHCAYAHGPDDLRHPVFDCSEDSSPTNSSINLLASHLEKDIIHNEDPAWNDPHYVLINYKTDQCSRPHRLCRQGYACPSFHNPRDKRRSPKIHKYRSTPCPNVKRGDEWGDPPLCDAGDNCSYCHTRTEQQFHPEIYKSTKCNDMVQTGYCPRGQFCAFAHLERELSESWEVVSSSEACIADYVEAILPSSVPVTLSTNNLPNSDNTTDANKSSDYYNLRKSSLPVEPNFEAMASTEDVFNSSPVNLSYLNKPEPIGKRRTLSLSEGTSRYTGNNLGTVHEKHPLQCFIPPASPSNLNKDQINQWAYYNNTNNTFNNNSNNNAFYEKMLNYPPENTVESVIVNALDGDVGQLNLKDEQDNNASLNPNYQAYETYYSGASRPMKIPNNNNPNSLLNNNPNPNNNNISHSHGAVKDDCFAYGHSYSLLAPIGSEHAASMLFDKSSTSTLTERTYQQGRPNNTFFPSSSLPLSPGVATNMPMSNMLERGDNVFDVLKNENNLLRMQLNDAQSEREKLMRNLEQLNTENLLLGKDRDVAVHKFNSVVNELSVLKNNLGGQTMLPQMQQHHSQLQQQLHHQHSQLQQQHPQLQQQHLQLQQQHTHIQQQQSLLPNESLIFNDVQQLVRDPNAQMSQYVTSETASSGLCSTCGQASDKLIPMSCEKCYACASCCTGGSNCFKCAPQPS